MKAFRQAVFPVIIAILLVASAAFGQTPEQDDSTQSAPAALRDPQPASSDDASLPPSASGGGVLGPDYVVGPEDVLTIEVFNVPELKQTVRVENDGTIAVKVLGRIKAAGLTTQGLKEELQSKWGQSYLQDPEVTVFVREFHGRPVSVIGAVEKPGLYQIPGPRSLIEMLSIAGGLAKRPNGGAGRSVYVTRKQGFGDLEPATGMTVVASDQVEINLKLLLYSRDSALNIPIKPFDVISVSKAGIVYVAGEVKKPGGFLLDDRDTFTVIEALALAEGVTGNAAKKSARIIHRADDGSFTETAIDVGKIQNGKAEDVVLASNDVLFVPNSRSKYVSKRTAESVIGTLTGLIVFRGGL